MTLDDVKRALLLSRPGRPAHVRLSPRPRPGDVYPLPPDLVPKEAGVLILLFPGEDDLNFFLTLRTETVESHKGQVSLPGGAQEADETLAETAVRETCEELGIAPTRIQLIGESLSPVYIPVSGFRVTPFVAFTPARPPVRAEPGEVVEIIEMSLGRLLDEQCIAEEKWDVRGFSMVVPFFSINEHKVWGATAMMLGEFREMLQAAQSSAQTVEDQWTIADSARPG